MNNDQKDKGRARETRIMKENVFKNPGKSKFLGFCGRKRYTYKHAHSTFSFFMKDILLFFKKSRDF